MNLAISSMKLTYAAGCSSRKRTTAGSTPGQRPQRAFPVGVGERSGVEDEIGVAGNAVLEPEGFELAATSRSRRARLSTTAAHQVAQLVHAHARGVDDLIGDD